ncbi:heme oxygenase [Terriglobus roseus DSM 18391]|uniref:Heme oxygenase n=1 Tax=Terriglobus roseus (strain DSM 18391 / NRRL B-41598 / KBS 63) TaxID=926566 RepID=I3ZCH6_TERRK|nr:biliverdin-producing heme oxygenase [Terriglobus roseus]AFL86944.1 heme oxygenase [Terriglobus roseus DSM 18391]
MDTLRLRQATAADHAGTEDSVPLMSPTLTREQYVDVLRRFYRIVRAWDAWADQHAPEDLRAMVAERRRASLLADDLKTMGESAPPTEDDVPNGPMTATAVAGDPRAVFLGRMYVMEGSTLGGQLLARHVEQQLGLQPGLGDSYFAGYGDHTGQRWREFKSLLEALPEDDADTVIASAKNMFTLFGDSMRTSIAPKEIVAAS